MSHVGLDLYKSSGRASQVSAGGPPKVDLQP